MGKNPNLTTKALRAYHSGVAAETAVERTYLRNGAMLLETRWRGESGEIDLIFLDQDEYVFCEVKKAKYKLQAIQRLQPKQMQRIHAAAAEYLEFTPQGQLSNVRFDLATVDGTGNVQVFKHAFSHF